MKKTIMFPALLSISLIITFSYSYYYCNMPSKFNEYSGVKYYYSPLNMGQDQKVVCIVFDDGWKSQFDAIPVLDKYGFKATFAIITSYTGNKPGYLDWSQMQKLANDGHDIESHSHTHKSLNNMSENDLVQEISESKRILREKGFDSELFVYPLGDGWDNSTVRDLVSKYYLAARCIGETLYNVQNGDRYAITSYGISNQTTLDDLMSYLDGSGENLISVIYYHQIGDSSVTLSQFESEMSYLNSNGYRVMTLRDVLFKGK